MAMNLILTGWIAFFVASFLGSIFVLTYVQSRAVARYGLRESMERAQRAPLDMYWARTVPVGARSRVAWTRSVCTHRLRGCYLGSYRAKY
jgi:hypothetical protein